MNTTLQKYLYIIAVTFLFSGCTEGHEESMEPAHQTEQAQHFFRPTVQEKGKRGRIRWKSKDSGSLAKVDPILFTQPSAELNKWLQEHIEAYCMTADGKSTYVFTPKDMEQWSVKKIDYRSEQNVLEIIPAYAGVAAQQPSYLSYSPILFYGAQFTTHQNFVVQHYLNGVYRNIESEWTSLISYDSSRYTIEKMLGASVEQVANEIHLVLQISDKKIPGSVASIEVSITGFKPLQELLQQITIVPTSETYSFLSRWVKNKKEQDSNLTATFRQVFTSRIWWNMVRFQYENTNLVVKQRDLMGDEQHSDIYLRQPTFELLRAERQENDLVMHIIMTQVNGIRLQPMTYVLRLADFWA